MLTDQDLAELELSLAHKTIDKLLRQLSDMQFQGAESATLAENQMLRQELEAERRKSP